MNREMGEILGLSIGTALALEPYIDNSVPVWVKVLYINVRTLARNYIQAYDDPYIVSHTEHEVIFNEELYTLIELIPSIYTDVSVVLYGTNHATLVKQLPFASHKVKFTHKQETYRRLEWRLISGIPKDLNVFDFDSRIKGNNKQALIITHLPLDLLSYTGFKKLQLLESHTGVIKERKHWIGKCTKNKKAMVLPFNILTIQCLGDGNHLLQSKGAIIVKPLLTLANDNLWKPSTTMDKVKYDIKKIKDPYLKSMLLNMSRASLKV